MPPIRKLSRADPRKLRLRKKIPLDLGSSLGNVGDPVWAMGK
jgi:hypothetical protein